MILAMELKKIRSMGEADRMGLIPFLERRKMFEEVMGREKLGQKIIRFEIGRPDFDTPQHIKKVTKRALDEGKVHYTSTHGIPELKEAINENLSKLNGFSFDPFTEIIVTVGTDEAVFIAMLAFINIGDEVLISDPFGLHYFFCAQLEGAVPILVSAKEKNHFHSRIDNVKSRFTFKTRMIINSPNNPIGAVYSSDILDDRLVFLLCSIRSVAADQKLISALIRIHQYPTASETTFPKRGVVEALIGSQVDVEMMVREFDQKRNLVYDTLQECLG